MKTMYKCDVCAYSSSSISHFNTHVDMHKGVKPFACDFPGCIFRSTQKSNVKIHYNAVHEGEKPFACDFPGCTYSTVQERDVTDHYNAVHEGIKPFACNFDDCAYRSSQRSHLTRHLKSKHNIDNSNTVKSKLEYIAPVSKEETTYMDEPIFEMSEEDLEKYVNSLVGSDTFNFKES